jgi:hypothetical protein
MANTKQYHFVVCFDEHDKTWRIEHILGTYLLGAQVVYDPTDDGIDGSNGWEFATGSNAETYDRLCKQLDKKLEG